MFHERPLIVSIVSALLEALDTARPLLALGGRQFEAISSQQSKVVGVFEELSYKACRHSLDGRCGM